MEFKAWPKIPRLENTNWTITEKIDGTNACIIISNDGTEIAAQSRTRLITPDNDNAGFARWVQENKEDLTTEKQKLPDYSPDQLNLSAPLSEPPLSDTTEKSNKEKYNIF